MAIKSIILGLLMLILIGGLIFSVVEDIHYIDSIYFSFITGFTVGYGDIVPHTHVGRLISVMISFIGILFTGIMVGISTRAIIITFKKD